MGVSKALILRLNALDGLLERKDPGMQSQPTYAIAALELGLILLYSTELSWIRSPLSSDMGIRSSSFICL